MFTNGKNTRNQKSHLLFLRNMCVLTEFVFSYILGQRKSYPQAPTFMTQKHNQAQIIPMEMKELALTLRNLRKESGFSLREAARNANISPSYLSKIEAGDTFTTIGIKTLLSLAKAYNTSLVVILQESGLLENADKLPELPQYLRLKYSLSHQAIRDMEMAKEIVDKKYKTLVHLINTSSEKNNNE